MERSKLHMSNKKRITPNKKYDQRDSLKPNGLWYSFGCEWISWCLSEMKEWIGNYSHEIELKYDDILVLETGQDVANFEKEVLRKLKISEPDILIKIRSEQKINEEVESRLKKFIETFLENFTNR